MDVTFSFRQFLSGLVQKKSFLLKHQSTRNCTMSLQGQGVSVYNNYYPLFVSVLLTPCWVSLVKHIQTAPTALSDIRAALIQPACEQHLPCPGTCVQLLHDRTRGQWLTIALGCAPSWSGAFQPGTAEVNFAFFICSIIHSSVTPSYLILEGDKLYPLPDCTKLHLDGRTQEILIYIWAALLG